LVGVAINSKALDKLGLKKVCYLNMAFLAVWLTTVILYNHFNTFSLWSAGIMTFTYGIQDSGLNIFINCCCGFEFESKTTPFSLYKGI
jgi:hypothetical protein